MIILNLTKYYMPNLKEEQFKQIIREWNLLKYKNKFLQYKGKCT